MLKRAVLVPRSNHGPTNRIVQNAQFSRLTAYKPLRPSYVNGVRRADQPPVFRYSMHMAYNHSIPLVELGNT